MKLTAYLEQRDIRPARFAADLGVPPSTISRIISGKRTPRLDTAQKIAAATKGAVSLADLVASNEANQFPDEVTGDPATAPQRAGALSPEMV